VYQLFRRFEELPRIFPHLVSVEQRGPSITHWVAKGPGTSTVAWDAEINNEVEGELIGWRSLSGSDVDTAGSVHFKNAPGGRGTEVVVHLKYDPPAGLVGATLAKVFGRDAETEIETGLFRMKQILEAGEFATAEGQPKGPRIPHRQQRTNGQEQNMNQEVTA